MIAVFVCVENNAAVINWQDFFKTSLHVDIPQLQVAAVFLLPVFVKIDNGIQSAFNIKFFVESEVRVHTQETTIFCFMQSATGKVWVGYQTFDARQLFKKLQHGCRIKGVENRLQIGIAFVGADLSFVLTFIATLVEHFVVGWLDWEVRADTRNQVFR
ncbi:hypothetical protein D3C87_1704710 [compost metagenome]